MIHCTVRSLAPNLLQPGMIVAASVYPPDDDIGLPLVAPGVVITEALKQRLLRAGARTVQIDDEFSRDISPDPAITDQARRDASMAIRSTFSQVTQGIATGDGPALAPAQVDKMAAAMTSIMAELSFRKNLMTGLSDLSRFGGDRVQRAVNVTVVGITIGQRYLELWGWRDFKGNPRRDQFEDRIKKLGMGLMLMDIGMLSVPPDAWGRDLSKLSGEARQAVEQHPLSGVELLRDAAGDMSALLTIAIAQHHERFDGSGYPRGLEGEALHEHGLIAGIADTYITLTEDGPKGKPPRMAPHEAYAFILGESGRLFDERVVEAFYETVAPYGPGATVQISDGRSGVVVANSEDPSRPIVRVTHNALGKVIDPFEEIALGDNDDLYVELSLEGLPTDRE